MSAAEMTPSSDISVVNGNFDIHLVGVTKATADDWIHVDYPVLEMHFSSPAGSDETAKYLATTINGDITAAATSVVATAVTSFPTSGESMYIKVDAEIMEVSAWATLTLTVRRGAMGTTAATHTSGAALYVLTTIVLDGTVTGLMYGTLATRAVS